MCVRDQMASDITHNIQVADTSWLRVQLSPAIDYMTRLCVSFMPAVAQPLADFLKVCLTIECVILL